MKKLYVQLKHQFLMNTIVKNNVLVLKCFVKNFKFKNNNKVIKL